MHIDLKLEEFLKILNPTTIVVLFTGTGLPVKFCT
jgi:hypothetical protein